MSFTHLHLHTEYSLLDGVSRIEPLISRLKELNMKSVALTDHGVMLGIYEFYSKCKEAGIKPIIGCEIYVSPRTRFDKDPVKDRKSYHMTLLAKNLEGYKNLIKIVSIANLEGLYYKPRTDQEILGKYGKGIIALSGCMGGHIPRLLSLGRVRKAREAALKYIEYFGKDNFYIEVMRNGVKGQEELNQKLIALARELDLPIVATADAHYVNKGDHELQEVLWCIADGKKMSDTSRRKYDSEEFFVKSTEEMEELFKDLPEAIENTQKIVDSVEEFSISFDRIEPKFKGLPKGKDSKEYLRELVYEKLKQKYPDNWEDLVQRAEMELEVIFSKGYSDYFLVVQDYVNWARSKGIIVGPGRGSGPASLVGYSLGITSIDPIAWKLPFERFLNPERPSPPDYDIDFEDTRREEIITYMKEVYGNDCVVNVCTLGRMKTKAAIKDVARALGVDFNLADKFSKLIPVHQGKSPKIKDAIKEIAEIKELVDTNSSQLSKVVDIVSRIEGTARHLSTHACAMIVTPNSTVEYVPLQIETKTHTKIMTQYEGPSLESLGLMKFDFLGLSNLTLINDTIKMIKKTRGMEIDINKVGFDDKETYEKIFQPGETLGIFQFESEGMKKYLKDLKAQDIEELSFMAAAYRPGPMAFITPYIECKFKRKEPEYLHNDLIPVLEETYGYPIYQEQIMGIAQKMAGYTLGAADNLRRAMGKKKIEVLMAEKEKFIEGMLNQGYNQELADKLFEYMIPFSSYGFNKAHSACYAVIAYQTGYLKVHYYPEFMAVLLKVNLGDQEKASLIAEECSRMGVKILPPNINRSVGNFSIEEGNIRIGLKAIKGISKKAVKVIVKSRRDGRGDFIHLDDFCDRIMLDAVGKKSIELLIKCGAMDDFGDRGAMLKALDSIYARFSEKQKSALEGQYGLFDMFEKKENQGVSKTVLSNEVTSDTQKLVWEKELIGMYITSHPLSKLGAYCEKLKVVYVSAIDEKLVRKKVKVVGIITKLKQITTKTSGQSMAFITIEDLTGSLEGVVFPSTFESQKDNLQKDIPAIINGSIDKRNDKFNIIVDEIKMLTEEDIEKARKAELKKAKDETFKSLIVNIPSNITKTSLDLLSSTFKSESINGSVKVKLIIPSSGKNEIINLPYKINFSQKIKSTLISILGPDGFKGE